MFVGEFVIDDDVDCVEITGAGGVAGEDGCGESALQRGETEEGIAVTAENDLDEAVAESADAVVEKDGVGHGVRAGTTLFRRPAVAGRHSSRSWSALPVCCGL